MRPNIEKLDARVAKVIADRAARRAERAKLARRRVVAGSASYAIDNEDPRRLTRWVDCRQKEPSGHAGGRVLSGRAWLQAEAAAFAARGRQVVIVNHATLKDHSALCLV